MRESWGAVRVSDYALAQTAYALSQSKLWLPGRRDADDLRVSLLGEVGELGRYHLDISGPPPRAPFTKTASSETATYPCLWNHDARRETRLICPHDSRVTGLARIERKRPLQFGLQRQPRAHGNRDFRFNSQPLAAAFTERESLGGIAWPNVSFPNNRFDYALSIWCNCTLGLLSYWWHANRQQSGRGRTTIRAVVSLPVLDFRELTDDQLIMSELIFEDFRDKELKPAYLADADPNRALLDRRVVCDLLGFDEETYVGVRRLAAKWCAEPSVHGGKSRPRGSGLVV